MTKLELSLSLGSLDCVSLEGKTAEILGVTESRIHISALLADSEEFQCLQNSVGKLVDAAAQRTAPAFETLNLVFRARNVNMAPAADRSEVKGVFRSPIRAIHTAREQHLACFVYLYLDGNIIQVTAVEYGRDHREKMLREEFGSWLLEEHIEKAVVATDHNGKIVFWNRFASQLFQWERHEVLGKETTDVLVTDMTREQAVEIMSRLMRGEHWSGLFGVQRKDGSQFMAHVTDAPVLDADGVLKYIVGVSADYSELHNLMKKLESLNQNLEEEVRSRTKQLLDKEQTLRMVGAAVKQSDVGVIILDEFHNITWTNDAVLKFVHMSKDEVHGRLPWDLPIKYGEEDSSSNDGDLKCFFLSPTREMQTTTARIACGTEEVLFVSIGVQAMADSKNVLITMRDLTAQRKIDQAELEAEKAKAASASKTEMVQMLSHEFRTPLQGIMGVSSTSLADMGPEDGEIYDNLSAILASSRILLTLINNVLDLGKLESNRMETLDLSPVLISLCVQDSIHYCLPFAKMNEVDIVWEDANDETIVLANRLRLEQVLINLLSNGIKYTKRGSTIVVSVRKCPVTDALLEAMNAPASDLHNNSLIKKELATGEAVVISIEDEGRGIPQNEFSKLFNEYVQLEVSKNLDRKYSGGGKLPGQSSGSGLGLSLVSKFMARMNGWTICDNKKSGEGAIFSIVLPTQTNPDTRISSYAQIMEMERKKTEVDISIVDVENIRVLLLDDSLINLKVLHRMLTRLGVRHIVSFSAGSEALNYLSSIQGSEKIPNLILSDLQMPEMNGYEFMTRLQEVKTTWLNSTKFIAISADWTTEAEINCNEVGFDGLLRKPVTFPDLKEFLAGLNMTWKQ